MSHRVLLLACTLHAQVSENAALPFTPASVTVWGEEEVAVGGEDNKVYVFSLLDAAQPKATIVGPRGQVGCCCGVGRWEDCGKLLFRTRRR